MKTSRTRLALLIALALVLVACGGGDDVRVGASSDTESTPSEPVPPDGFYAAIPITATPDRRESRAEAAQARSAARSRGYSQARILYNNGGPGDCVRGPVAADGSYSEACGTATAHYIVALEGPFTEQRQLSGDTTEQQQKAFSEWHEAKTRDVQDRARRRGLDREIIVSYFYVADGESADDSMP